MVEVKVTQEEGTDTLEIQITGQGHTLMVGLRNELFKDENVITAGYAIKHPLSPNPKLYIKTNGKETARDALKKAAISLISQLDEFKEKFSKAFEVVIKD